MKEVEIKAKLNGMHDSPESIEARTGLRWEESVDQKDTIFLPVGMDFGNLTDGSPVFRLREVDGATILTLKISSADASERAEEEILVDDSSKTRRIVELLGFSEAITIEKRRRKMNFGEYLLFFDDVQDLGQFLEIEKLVDDNVDAGPIKEDMIASLQALGLEDLTVVNRSYDALLYQARTYNS